MNLIGAGLSSVFFSVGFPAQDVPHLIEESEVYTVSSETGYACRNFERSAIAESTGESVSLVFSDGRDNQSFDFPSARMPMEDAGYLTQKWCDGFDTPKLAELSKLQGAKVIMQNILHPFGG